MVGRRLAAVVGIVVVALGLGASLPAAAAGSGSISGRVTDGNGNPLAGICVNAEGNPPTQTDVNGAYTLTGLGDGSFKIQYTDCNPSPQYVSQWYLNRPDSMSADPVPVTDGVDTPVQDVVLALGVAVGGTVTDTNGTPLAGIAVNVNPTTPGGQSTGTQTDANGTYTTGPLPPGDYQVQFSDMGSPTVWARQFWNGQPAQGTRPTRSR